VPRSSARRQAGVAAARTAGRQWRCYLGLLGVAAVAVVVSSMAPHVDLRRGYVGVVVIVAAVLLVLSLVGRAAPEAGTPLAEEWTVAVLRRMCGWQVVADAPLPQGTVAAIAMAPAAVLAVHSAHQPTADSADRLAEERVRRQIGAAEHAAQLVRQYLRTRRPDPVVVIPVVMIWGPVAAQFAEGYRIERGVHLLDGRHPELWMHLFAAPRLDAGARHDLSSDFERLVQPEPEPRDEDGAVLPAAMWHAFRSGIVSERSDRSARDGRPRRTAGQPDDVAPDTDRRSTVAAGSTPGRR
jgi:hypothetical protein